MCSIVDGTNIIEWALACSWNWRVQITDKTEQWLFGHIDRTVGEKYELKNTGYTVISFITTLQAGLLT